MTCKKRDEVLQRELGRGLKTGCIPMPCRVSTGIGGMVRIICDEKVVRG